MTSKIHKNCFFRFHYNYCTLFLFSYIYIFCYSLPTSDAQSNNTISQYTTKDGLTGNKVYDIAQDSKGYLWIATNNGICKFDGMKFTCFDSDDGLENVEILKILIDKYDRIWLNSITKKPMYINDQTCFSLDLLGDTLNTNIFNTSISPSGSIEILKGLNMYEYNVDVLNFISKKKLSRVESFFIFHDDEEEFTGFFNDTLYYKVSAKTINGYTTAADSIPQRNNSLSKYANLYIEPSINNSLQKIKNNRYWYVPTSNGLYIVDLHDLSLSPKVLFNDNNIFSFMETKDNIIWAGTSHHGLFKFNTTTLYDKESKIKYLSIENIANIITSGEHLFFTDESGNLFSYSNNKVKKIHLTNKHFKTVARNHQPIDDKFEHGLAPYDIIANKNSFYIVDPIRLYKTNKKLNEWDIIYKTPTNLSFKKIVPLKDSTILILGSGVVLIKNEKVITKKTLASGSRTYKYHHVNDSTFYLGTTGGIYSLHLKDNNIFIKRINTSNIQSVKGIRLINDSSLVVGTRNGGLSLYHKPFTSKSQPTKKILSGVVIYDLLHINSKVYLGTSDGVYVIDVNSFQVVQHLNTLNILSSNEVLDLEIHDTMLVVATSSGVDFIPLSYHVDVDTPTIYFDRIFVNGELTDLTKNKRVNHNNNTLEFIFSSPYFGDNKLTYISELENVDFQPIASEESRRMYPNLDPGDYIFKVKVKIAHLESKTKEIEFTIKPPWWNTWWFYGLLFVILLSIIYWLYRQQVNRQKAQISLLRQQLNTIQAQMNPHFLFNALQSLQYYIYKKEIKKSLKYLKALTTVMRKTLDNTSSKYVSIHDELLYLESYLILEKERLNDNLQFDIEFDEGLKNYLIPSVTLQPFLENAIIHGFINRSKQHNKLYISISPIDKKTIRCKIVDNGIGILQAETPKQHKSFASKAVQKKLEIIQQLEKEQSKSTKIKISIYDNSQINNPKFEKGTTVLLNLPCYAK